jgi:hypothetical protein
MKPRPFGILDAMLCIAAVAVGLGANRAEWERLQHQDRPSPFYDLLWLWLPHLSAWTVAVLIMHLRPPRPSFGRLMRRPGAVACLASFAFAFVIAGMFAIIAVEANFVWPGERLIDLPRRPIAAYVIDYCRLVGIAVIGAWLALAAPGRWRPEPTWIDRLGRALGLTWIAVSLVTWTLLLLELSGRG